MSIGQYCLYEKECPGWRKATWSRSKAEAHLAALKLMGMQPRQEMPSIQLLSLCFKGHLPVSDPSTGLCLSYPHGAGRHEVGLVGNPTHFSIWRPDLNLSVSRTTLKCVWLSNQIPSQMSIRLPAQRDSFKALFSGLYSKWQQLATSRKWHKKKGGGGREGKRKAPTMSRAESDICEASCFKISCKILDGCPCCCSLRHFKLCSQKISV